MIICVILTIVSDGIAEGIVIIVVGLAIIVVCVVLVGIVVSRLSNPNLQFVTLL